MPVGSSSQVFDVTDFAQAMQRVSDDIKREVGALIQPTAHEMGSLLHARYPLGRKPHPWIPHMREDILERQIQRGQDAFLPVWKVTAPRLAYIWQDGTVQRSDATRKNANRGRMPAADPKLFERTAARVRASMLRLAQGILDRPRKID